jgi:hypothetical protein
VFCFVLLVLVLVCCWIPGLFAGLGLDCCWILDLFSGWFSGLLVGWWFAVGGFAGWFAGRWFAVDDFFGVSSSPFLPRILAVRLFLKRCQPVLE